MCGCFLVKFPGNVLKLKILQDKYLEFEGDSLIVNVLEYLVNCKYKIIFNFSRTSIIRFSIYRFPRLTVKGHICIKYNKFDA